MSKTKYELSASLSAAKKSEEWAAANAVKYTLLAKLSAFEKMAKELTWPSHFVRLAEEIGASKAAPDELVNQLDLLLRMADWLDPLVKAPSPNIDKVADKNPHRLW